MNTVTKVSTSVSDIVDRNFHWAAERLKLGEAERLGLKTPFREVKVEMSKVSFPSKDEVVGTTMVVLAASFVFAFYLWIADLVIVQLFKVIGS